MSEELDKLQKIGVEKIYEATHIPIQFIKAVLNNDFSSFSKVQLSGFLSILEREYQINLNDVRSSANSYFSEKEDKHFEAGVFVTPKRNSKNKFIIFMSLMIVVFFIFIYSISTKEAPVENIVVDNALINSVVEEINITKDKTQDDSNLSSQVEVLEETNSTQEVLIEVPQIEKEVVQKSFTIIPKSKVWFGYIDVKTNKKYQRTFSKELELDPNKRWLLMFGHGYIDMFVNGKAQKFSSRGKVRFLYEDGEVRAISLKEFKRLNRGRKW